MKTLCQTQRNKYCMTLLTSRGTVIETESKVEVTRDWREGKMRSYPVLNGYTLCLE